MFRRPDGARAFGVRRFIAALVCRGAAFFDASVSDEVPAPQEQGRFATDESGDESPHSKGWCRASLVGLASLGPLYDTISHQT